MKRLISGKNKKIKQEDKTVDENITKTFSPPSTDLNVIKTGSLHPSPITQSTVPPAVELTAEEKAKRVKQHLVDVFATRGKGKYLFMDIGLGTGRGVGAFTLSDYLSNALEVEKVESTNGTVGYRLVSKLTGLLKTQYSIESQEFDSEFAKDPNPSDSTGMHSYPTALSKLIVAINDKWGRGSEIAKPISQKKDIDGYSYEYKYGFEIAPEKVQLILSQMSSQSSKTINPSNS